MATSGTFLFNPDLAEIVDEAFERCRVDPAGLTIRHIRSARRSMDFMLVGWAAEGYHNFRSTETSLTLTDGTASYTDPDIATSIIDITTAVLRRDGVDTPIIAIGRDEYQSIPEKDTEGRPDRMWVDKGRDGITVTFWPVPENSTDAFRYTAIRKFEDHDTASDNPDIPYYMREAFVAGLAAKLAEKWAPPELEPGLIQKAAVAFRKGVNAQRERKDVRIIPGSGRRRRGSSRSYR